MKYDQQHIVTVADGNTPGLMQAIRDAGHDVENHNGVLYATDGAIVQAIIDAFDARPSALSVKLAELADFRWKKETGGMTANGVVIETTDRSKTLVTGAVLLAQSNPAATFKFKTTKDQHVDVDAAGMVAIYAALGAHVQECFAKEEAIAAKINALATWQEIVAFDIDAEWNT